MFGGRDVHRHAAHRIDRDVSGLVGVAMVAAAAGMNRRRCAMRMAGVSRLAVCVIVIGHQNSPGLLNYIPQGGI
jgi:hypothetical protein